MFKLSLANQLVMVIVALTTLLVGLTTAAIGGGVYILTEQKVKNDLVTDAKEIVTEYITIVSGEIRQKERQDEILLGTIARTKDISLLIVDRDNNVLARYGIYRDLSGDNLKVRQTEKGEYFDKIIEGYGVIDSYSMPIVNSGQTFGYLQISRKNSEVVILKSALGTTALILLPLSWILALIVGLIVTRKITKPLEDLVSKIEELDPDTLSELHVKDAHQKEVAIVVAAINRLVKKLRDSYRHQRQITENISHEFKTPLTRITSNLQVGHTKAAEEEAIALGKNVDALLSLALWEKEQNVNCDINLIIRKIAKEIPRDYQVKIYLSKNFIIPLPSAHARIIFRNLIDNAVKHNVNGGYIHVSGSMRQGNWEISVTNSCDTRPDIKLVTKRGYKGSKSTGSGIGMAIVRGMCKLYNLELNMAARDNRVIVMVSSSAKVKD